MKNKDKLIKIYNKALESGELSHNGLCTVLQAHCINIDKLNLFKPNKLSLGYWAADLCSIDSYRDRFYKFTPLRQTILAFLIVMEE